MGFKAIQTFESPFYYIQSHQMPQAENYSGKSLELRPDFVEGMFGLVAVLTKKFRNKTSTQAADSNRRQNPMRPTKPKTAAKAGSDYFAASDKFSTDEYLFGAFLF